MESTQKDQGWSWIVCGGAFVSLWLETGMVKGLALLLPALREEFSAYTWQIGLVISLIPGFGAIACMISSVVCKTISRRIAMMIFGLLSSVGLIVGSYASSISVLSVCVLFNGFSLGAEAVTISTLPSYFDIYYDLANGISHVGLSFGVMTMPIISQLFLQLYGWRGTFLLLGGLNLHLVVCGSLLRPLKSSSINTEGKGFATLSNKKIKPDFFNTVCNLLSLHLFRNWDFICALWLITAVGYYYVGWLIYFVPHGEHIGFAPYEASLLATGGGIGNLIGALIFPVSGKFLSGKKILYLSVLITCVSLGVDPLMTRMHSYTGLMVSSFGVNFGFAITDCAVFKETVNFVDELDLSNAVNWYFVGYSIGSISSGFTSGWLFDRFGDYSVSFLLLCIISALSILPWAVSDVSSRITLLRRGYFYLL